MMNLIDLIASKGEQITPAQPAASAIAARCSTRSEAVGNLLESIPASPMASVVMLVSTVTPKTPRLWSS